MPLHEHRDFALGPCRRPLLECGPAREVGGGSTRGSPPPPRPRAPLEALSRARLSRDALEQLDEPSGLRDDAEAVEHLDQARGEVEAAAARRLGGNGRAALGALPRVAATAADLAGAVVVARGDDADAPSFNDAVEQVGANVAAQFLQTEGDLGYAVADLEGDLPADFLDRVRAIDGTIRARLIKG